MNFGNTSSIGSTLKGTISLCLLIAILVNQALPCNAMYLPGDELETDQPRPLSRPLVSRNSSLPDWSPIAGIRFMGLSQTIYINWALSHLSPTDLAVAELKGPSQDFFYTIGVGGVYAMEDLVAEEQGLLSIAKERRDESAVLLHQSITGDIFRTANTIELLSSIPVIILLKGLAPSMIRFGYNADLYNSVGVFNQFYALCTPLFHLSFVAENFTIAEGKPSNALIMSGLTLLLCTVDYGFIGGPFRTDNVFYGLGISETVKAIVYTTGFYTLFKASSRYQHYRMFEFGFDMEIAKRLLTRSVPIFFQKLLMGLSPVVLVQLILPDKEEFLAANALFSQYFLIGQIFERAIGKWLNLALKTPSAAGDVDEVKRLAVKGYIHSQAFISVLALSVFLWPGYLASFFIDVEASANSEMMQVYISISKYKALDYMFSTLANITSWALRGVGQMKKAATIDIATSYLVTIPLSHYLVNSCGYGLWGLAIGSLSGNIANCILMQHAWWASVEPETSNQGIVYMIWGSAQEPSLLRRACSSCVNFLTGFW